MAELDQLRMEVEELERDIAWKQRRARFLTFSTLSVLTCIPVLIAWNSFYAADRRMLMVGRGPLVTVLVVGCLTTAVICMDHLIRGDPLDWRDMYNVPDRYDHSSPQLRHLLEKKREQLRRASLRAHPPLSARRGLYREDTAQLIAQYGRESRHYRRIHNALQSLIMVGSTAVTTIAALSQQEWTWQSISVVALGFSVTLASAFTGYYKYRERSYFLRQTADAIEEELNAVLLGIGEYIHFTEDQEDEALAKFTQRVEALRNEQRRREQQLDQPAEQAASADAPPA